MADILFPSDYAGNPWSQDSVFCGLPIPIQFLNPLCSTLKELIGSRCYSRVRDCISIESAFAFALRHLPKLEKTGVPGALKLLHQLDGTVNHQKPFEEAWRTAADRLGLDITSPVTFFYSGALSLKKVFNIPTVDDSVLLTVSELCPHIEEVGFAEMKSSISHSSLEKIIQPWSNKIEALTFSFRDTEFLMMVLNMIGLNLKKLIFTSSYRFYHEVDMDYLASICINLEHLALCEAVMVQMDPEAVSRWTTETFLPKLSHFQSSHCLGIWSNLIERKSTLVHLSLECCHIGTKVLNHRIGWSRLPQLWPQLESLEIRDRRGLTVNILAKMIPQFEKLRRITLPSYFLSEKGELKRKIMLKESPNNSEEPVNVEYHRSYWERSGCVLFSLV